MKNAIVILAALSALSAFAADELTAPAINTVPSTTQSAPAKHVVRKGKKAKKSNKKSKKTPAAQPAAAPVTTN